MQASAREQTSNRRKDDLAAYQVVGGVTAYQAYDE